jgi:hypothetical protein
VRKLITLALVSLLCLSLSGCFLTSMQPFYEPGKTLYDPALLGTWHMKNCSENEDVKEKYCVLVIEPGRTERDGKPEKGYRLTFRDERNLGSEYEGSLFEAGGARFLDTSMKEGPKVDIAFAIHVVTGHVAWKTEVAGQTLSLTPLKRSLAREAASLQPPAATFDYDGDTILSGKTPEVRALLEKFAMNPESYEKTLQWKKGPAPGTPKKK